ncbi:hypothetical protein, partial [Salmonella enterica]|uniref:hypothetical protein n=1 Tax=Salmonella enterica TaxID=28901 RepID=UPI001F43676A
MFFFFFSRKSRHTIFLPVSWPRRCVKETAGTPSTSLPGLAEDLAASAARQLEAAFPLAAFTAARPVPGDPEPLPLAEDADALAGADRAAAALAPASYPPLTPPPTRAYSGD